jgi:transposase
MRGFEGNGQLSTDHEAPRDGAVAPDKPLLVEASVEWRGALNSAGVQFAAQGPGRSQGHFEREPSDMSTSLHSETIAMMKLIPHPDNPGVPAELPLDAVIFREDLYPRIEKNPATVQKYAEDLDVLPSIEVNQHNELIDGWHRWTAHRKRKAATIRVTVTHTASDGELLELAIERNSTHGLQLSQEDKRDMARRIYTATPVEKQGQKKQRLAEMLSVTLRTIQQWLSRIDKDNQEKRDATVFNLWLACYTEEQIAEKVGMSRTGVERILRKTKPFALCQNPANSLMTRKGRSAAKKSALS